MKTLEEWQQETQEQLARIWEGALITSKTLGEIEDWVRATAEKDLHSDVFARITRISATRQFGVINVVVDYRPEMQTLNIGVIKLCVASGCERQGKIDTRIRRIGEQWCVEHWIAHQHFNDGELAALRHYFTEDEVA